MGLRSAKTFSREFVLGLRAPPPRAASVTFLLTFALRQSIKKSQCDSCVGRKFDVTENRSMKLATKKAAKKAPAKKAAKKAAKKK